MHFVSKAFTFTLRWLKNAFTGDAGETSPRLPAPIPASQAKELPSPERPALTAAPARKASKIEVVDECYDVGYQTARKSWKQEPDEVDLKALEARAEATAHSRHRPASEDRDQRQREKLNKVEDEIKRRGAQRDAAAAQWRECRQQRAKLGPHKPYPEIKPIFRQAAVIGLVVAFAPSFHDLMVGLPAILKWVFGVACALGVSLLVVHGILPPGPPEAKD